MARGNRVFIMPVSGGIMPLQPGIMRAAFYKDRFLMQFCNVIYN